MFKEETPNISVKRSEVVRAMAVYTHKGIKPCNGMIHRFHDNAVVVVNQEGKPRGT